MPRADSTPVAVRVDLLPGTAGGALPVTVPAPLREAPALDGDALPDGVAAVVLVTPDLATVRVAGWQQAVLAARTTDDLVSWVPDLDLSAPLRRWAGEGLPVHLVVAPAPVLLARSEVETLRRVSEALADDPDLGDPAERGRWLADLADRLRAHDGERSVSRECPLPVVLAPLVQAEAEHLLTIAAECGVTVHGDPRPVPDPAGPADPHADRDCRGDDADVVDVGADLVAVLLEATRVASRRSQRPAGGPRPAAAAVPVSLAQRAWRRLTGGGGRG
ncbi:MAG: hypothetical protein Q8Q02_17075 [Nocardioides sp.]|nr:hypothetical protein [Nocardioides sp.]